MKAYRKIVLTYRREVLSAGAFGRCGPGLARLAAEHTPNRVTVDGALSLDDLRQAFPGY